SGLTAVVVAMVTAWTVLAEWGRPGGKRPSNEMFAGILVGFAGVALLLLPGTLSGQARVSTLAVAVLMPASFLWAVGSIYSRYAELPRSTIMVAGMEMLCGGFMLAMAGLVSGEAAAFNLSAVSARSVTALAYLVVFGSLLAFTAFAWLLQVSTPAKVSTYGYINPMVAVILGWLFRGEHLSTREVFASLVIVGAVVVIVTSRSMTSGIRGLMRSGRRAPAEGKLESAKAGVAPAASPERASE
ncbi:MAG: EamA family transporter, partial [Gemmatimonadota bacterium]